MFLTNFFAVFLGILSAMIVWRFRRVLFAIVMSSGPFLFWNSLLVAYILSWIYYPAIAIVATWIIVGAGWAFNQERPWMPGPKKPKEPEIDYNKEII